MLTVWRCGLKTLTGLYRCTHYPDGRGLPVAAPISACNFESSTGARSQQRHRVGIGGVGGSAGRLAFVSGEQRGKGRDSENERLRVERIREEGIKAGKKQ